MNGLRSEAYLENGCPKCGADVEIVVRCPFCKEYLCEKCFGQGTGTICEKCFKGVKMKTDKIDLFVRLAQEAIETDEALEILFPGKYRTVGYSITTYHTEETDVKCRCYVAGYDLHIANTFKESLDALREMDKN